MQKVQFIVKWSYNKHGLRVMAPPCMLSLESPLVMCIGRRIAIAKHMHLICYLIYSNQLPRRIQVNNCLSIVSKLSTE